MVPLHAKFFGHKNQQQEVMLIGNKFADYESGSVRVEILFAPVSHGGRSGLFCLYKKGH